MYNSLKNANCATQARFLFEEVLLSQGQIRLNEMGDLEVNLRFDNIDNKFYSYIGHQINRYIIFICIINISISLHVSILKVIVLYLFEVKKLINI